MAKRTYTQAYATLCLSGRTLDPFAVTKALKLPPDHIHREGKPRLSRSKSGRVLEFAPHRQGMWLMSSGQHVDSPSVTTHIRWILGQLEGREHALERLLADGLKADIYCYSLGSSPLAPSVPKSVRDQAAAFGLAIEIDHYEDDTGDAV